jgi:hypothetical protein
VGLFGLVLVTGAWLGRTEVELFQSQDNDHFIVANHHGSESDSLAWSVVRGVKPDGTPIRQLKLLNNFQQLRQHQCQFTQCLQQVLKVLGGAVECT